jgi:hypothetical protein
MTVLSKPSKAEGLSPFSIYLSTRQDGVWLIHSLPLDSQTGLDHP